MYGQQYAEFQPELDLDPPARQNRLTVLLRALLLIPHYVVLFLLGIVAFFVAIAAWFCALALGKLPLWAQAFLGGYVLYSTRVYASFYLLTDRYPPFSFDRESDYPVRVELRPGELNRLAVLFRIILVIPAAIITSVITAGWGALSFFCWLVVLVMGRNPDPLSESTAAILRYSMRTSAYWLMLTSAYPKGLFGEGEAAPAGPGRLRLATGGKVMLVVFIAVGLISYISSASSDQDSANAPATSHIHRLSARNAVERARRRIRLVAGDDEGDAQRAAMSRQRLLPGCLSQHQDPVVHETVGVPPRREPILRQRHHDLPAGNGRGPVVGDVDLGGET
jgi:Domain of unknown function (DUF4389)